MLGGYHREIWQEPMNEVDMGNIVFPILNPENPHLGKLYKFHQWDISINAIKYLHAWDF